MKTNIYNTNVLKNPVILELLDFDDNDRKYWKELFEMWKNLKMGMRKYKSREPNFPEGLSEIAFCLYSGSNKFVSIKRGHCPGSFDTFNVNTNRAEQIKATSVGNDLTSFGPRSYWDDLYFLDFYNNGKLDGSFNVYLIPNDYIYTLKVNKTQTVMDQQKQGRRPRFSILKQIIEAKKIKPIASDVVVWK